MWLTQTYLAEPGQHFPAYAYFLFNPYTNWNSVQLHSIRAGLSELGRRTKSQLSILMPDGEIDKHEVGQQLDTRFRPLVDRLSSGGMRCGLLIANMPLATMAEDGSNARWVYLSFDDLLSDSDVKAEFHKFMALLAECAMQKGGDPIARFVLAQDDRRIRKNWNKFARLISPSASASGPALSLSFGELARFFTRDNSIVTNLLDSGSGE